MMSQDIEYRLVIDRITDEQVGVVKIDPNKWKGAHWIVDQDGDERRSYRFRRIDAAKYDTAIAFETHPVLEVRYKNYLRVFDDKEDLYGVLLLIAASGAVATSYILGTVIMFSDFIPELGNSVWYQIGYWLITFGTVVAGGGMLLSILSGYLLGQSETKKDVYVKEWLKFKQESLDESSPDV